MTATPHGVAFVKWGALWNVSLETGTVEQIEKATDIHGVASNDRALYWLGRFANGQYAYRTGEKTELRSYAGLGRQHGLEVGDAPYGIAENGAVWRIGKRHNSRVSAPQKNWRTGYRLLAGDEIIMFPLYDVGYDEVTRYLWRVRGRSKGEKLDIKVPCNYCKDLDMQGRLLYVEQGEVRLLGPRSETPRTLFETSDTSVLCWCGRDICTFSGEAGELRRHDRLEPDYTVVATEVGRPRSVSCNQKFVAWSTRSGEEHAVHVVALASAPIQSGTNPAERPTAGALP